MNTQTFDPRTATGVQRWYVNLHNIYAGITGNLSLRTFAEVGFGPVDIALAYQFHPHAKKLLLVEPNPTLFQQGIEVFPMADWHNVAIDVKEGTQQLVLNNGSSYLKNTEYAPTPVGNKRANIAMGMPAIPPKTHTVPTITFDTIDDGNIDCLNLDCEGNEWVVLQQMISRPRVLMIELWPNNPHLNSIVDWLFNNGYIALFTTGVKGETQVWYRQDD